MQWSVKMSKKAERSVILKANIPVCLNSILQGCFQEVRDLSLSSDNGVLTFLYCGSLMICYIIKKSGDDDELYCIFIC